MEENNMRYESGERYSDRHFCCKYCWCLIIAAFLGGFLAMYFVADQVFDRHHRHGYYGLNMPEHRMFNDFNKMYERNNRAFEREMEAFDKDFKKLQFPEKWFGTDKHKNQLSKSILNPFLLQDMTFDNVKIDTEIDDDEYNVIVSLKPFNGDDRKVNYNVSGRKLTVFGSSTVKDKNYEQDISFSQDFILPLNADISKISKKIDGNKLIIKVPLK